MPEIKTVRYSHDAIIDIILANPFASQGEIARESGYTQAWLSIIINSDAFKERMAERKAELRDPAIRASIEDRLDAVARRSLDKIMDKLDQPGQMKTMELVAIAKLGAGDRANRPAVPQNSLYVVHLPAPAQNSSDWLENTQGNPRGALPIVEEVPRG